MRRYTFGVAIGIVALCAITARATELVNTGLPDGLMATASRPVPPTGGAEIEAADDFILADPATVTGGTFHGLLPQGFALSGIQSVGVEIYRVFPNDSTNPPSGNVPTRANSPSDNVFSTRTTGLGSLTFTTTLLSASFSTANSVVNGINKIPGQFTGGEGSVSGEEVLFNFTFAPPMSLPADHYFFVPQVGLSSGNFLWLSSPKPIVSPGSPFSPDLQTWIRNTALDPDWLRVGTDISHQGPFNAAFTLDGESVPLPPAVWPALALLAGLGLVSWRRSGFIRAGMRRFA